MAHARDNHLSPSSQNSSSDVADSFKGTPDTRLTPFSADDSSAQSTNSARGFDSSAARTPPIKLPVSSRHGATSSIEKDPFTTPGRSKRLSPTASSFEPHLNQGALTAYTRTDLVAAALSTDIGLHRCLEVSYVTELSVSKVNTFLLELDEQGMQACGGRLAREGPPGDIVIQFDDIRDACKIRKALLSSDEGWQARFTDYSQVAKTHSLPPGTRASTSGQILVLAALEEGPVAIDIFQATEIVKRNLQQHGQLFALSRLTPSSNGSFRAVVEFCNVSAALSALTTGTGIFQVEGRSLIVSLSDTSASTGLDLDKALQRISLAGIPTGIVGPSANDAPIPRTTPAFDTGLQPAFGMYQMMIQPTFGPGAPYTPDGYSSTSQMSSMSLGHHGMGHPYQAPPSPALTSQNNQSPSRLIPGYGQLDAHRYGVTRVTRSPNHHGASHHNHVDIHRIRGGIDVRTTIMLRNIPNKVDQAMLKRIVDESSWGKYDFMYLRIDFANDCNVGYAFINFVDFVNTRGNQRWNCFKSDKIAEISYATIQGKDCLVQKFRNSSVMLEAVHYRPKLYFTSNGPQPDLAGQEEPFPEPDNQSKMKRSCENAEHVGLFTPNAGQHFRDEQRRRRSQYDRGTRLAALEEYDYEPPVHQLYGSKSQ